MAKRTVLVPEVFCLPISESCHLGVVLSIVAVVSVIVPFSKYVYEKIRYLHVEDDGT